MAGDVLLLADSHGRAGPHRGPRPNYGSARARLVRPSVGQHPVGRGGWDWFSIQLEDGSDAMLNLIRDDLGVTRLAYGTYVEPTGRTDIWAATSSSHAHGAWTSPRAGARYPMGWLARLPGRRSNCRSHPSWRTRSWMRCALPRRLLGRRERRGGHARWPPDTWPGLRGDDGLQRQLNRP